MGMDSGKNFLCSCGMFSVRGSLLLLRGMNNCPVCRKPIEINIGIPTMPTRTAQEVFERSPAYYKT